MVQTRDPIMYAVRASGVPDLVGIAVENDEKKRVASVSAFDNFGRMVERFSIRRKRTSIKTAYGIQAEAGLGDRRWNGGPDRSAEAG